MDKARGFILFIAGCIAFYYGFRILTGQRAVMAFALGAIAIALGVWRLLAKPALPRPRPRQ
jgi:hypothetical protein